MPKPLELKLSAVEALHLHEALEKAHRVVTNDTELKLIIELKVQVKEYFLTEHKLALR